MKNKFAVVITSINYPTQAIVNIAKKRRDIAFDFIVVGDHKSPQDFQISHCRFYSLEEQLNSNFKLAIKCPVGHYARKNLGYLLAITNQCDYLIETDDDNIPLEEFWQERKPYCEVPKISEQGWLNVYKYFSDSLIWPRGLPLDAIHKEVPNLEQITNESLYCPIQQGLADDNPDVDAIYRLVLPLPLKFNHQVQIALGKNTWCPFNSQNTTWFPEAYPLLYLPAYCSFRMTDIWRSFVAQSIAWANNWLILFHEPTVYQDRNEHNLMKDFEDEVVGYLHNQKIKETLSSLNLKPGLHYIGENMMICYEHLIKLNLIGTRELELLELWLSDLAQIKLAG